MNAADVDMILLTVSYDTTTLYFAKNFVSVTHNGNTYSPLPFDVTLPDDKETGDTSAQITMADINGDIYAMVRGVDEIFAEFSLIKMNDSEPHDVIRSFPNFKLNNASWNQSTVTFDLVRDDIGIYKFPADSMDNITFPGLY